MHNNEGGFFFFVFGVFFETGSHYVPQAGLELMILLPQPPQCWDYRDILSGFTKFHQVLLIKKKYGISRDSLADLHGLYQQNHKWITLNRWQRWCLNTWNICKKFSLLLLTASWGSALC
jgi:hypothetical protein